MLKRKGSGVVMMGLLAGAPDKARTFVLLDLYLYWDGALLCTLQCTTQQILKILF